MIGVTERGRVAAHQPVEASMTHGIALRCRSLAKAFGDEPVVRGVSFTVAPGDILVLVGPSGCGKTTTLRLIAGFERLDGGSIEIDGRIAADDQRHLPPERRRVGMVFQDYAVFPHLSVGRNVGFALGKTREAEERVAELLAFVGLPGQAHKMPHELSGGEQQRVSLARALSTEPVVLLLDEPFSNLDATLRADVRAEVRSLLKRGGTTAVFVTHDQEEALLLGDHVGVMRDGLLEQTDTPENIFHRPQTRFVAEFLGQTAFIPGQVADGEIVTPLGALPRPAGLVSGAMVEIAVRPDDVAFRPDEHGVGRVLTRRFTGMAYHYHLSLPDGVVVHSRQPHEMRVEEGATVSVHFHGQTVPPIFFEGRAVGTS
jgi:iron(III) transport system ATP-binding protein